MASSSNQPRDRYRVVACRECRRSKTKCNRSWPCQACIKRGCEDICPDGVLIKPAREKLIESSEATNLREENRQLLARIQQLEKAASLSPASSLNGSPRPVPNISPSESSGKDPSAPSSGEELINAYGTLSIGDTGHSKHFNQAASAEYLFEDDLECGEFVRGSVLLEGVPLPSEILHLAEIFPNGRSVRSTPELRQMILSFLPPANKVLALVELYYRHMGWMYDPIPRQQFMDRVYDRVFYSNRYGDVSDVTFDHVAVLFIVLALSVVMDLERPFVYEDSEPYYLLALAAFTLETKLIAATPTSIQALQLISIYSCLTDRISAEERWLLVGITIRMAQSAGLQHDFSSWQKYDAAEIERRRRLFWELFTYDTWTSFIMGRPAILANNKQFETKFPEDHFGVFKASGEPEPGFHHWKYKYTKECIMPILDEVLGAETPTYPTILRLDSVVRRFPVPQSLQLPPLDNTSGRSLGGANVSLEMQRYFIVWLKESTLLYLHRSYFTHAVSLCSDNPLQSKYAPSVLAAFRSASLMVGRLRQLSLEQLLAARIWTFWSSLFSAAIILGALVVRSPRCSLAACALKDLDIACQLIERGLISPRSMKAAAILRKLQRKAHQARARDSPEAGDGSALEEAVESGHSGEDELTIFGGQTRLVLGPILSTAERRARQPPLQAPDPSEAATLPQSLFPNAHPELWDDIGGLTPYETLSTFVPGNDPTFQSPDIIPDLGDFGYGLTATAIPDVNQQIMGYSGSTDQQSIGTWQSLINDMGMNNMEF